MSANRTEELAVEQSLPSERLDVFLRSKFPMVSRATLQRLIDEGEILVNGRKVKPTHHPHAGEIIRVHWPEPRTSEVKPEEMPLDILYEDEDLLVINKPPGLVVHPSIGHEKHTLVNALLHHCAGQLSGIGGVARPGIVHRLDKDTSGCLLVAKHDAAHVALAEQFAERSMEKIYHALVCGVIPRDAGEIRASIERHPSHRKRMAVTDGRGREAWTSYRAVERLLGATLVEAVLHTGRTHQIRVHFEYLGHPVIGDDVYGVRQNRKLRETTGYTAPRQMLHAQSITFLHPAKQEKMTFESDWPEDFREALKKLREQ